MLCAKTPFGTLKANTVIVENSTEDHLSVGLHLFGYEKNTTLDPITKDSGALFNYQNDAGRINTYTSIELAPREKKSVPTFAYCVDAVLVDTWDNAAKYHRDEKNLSSIINPGGKIETSNYKESTMGNQGCPARIRIKKSASGKGYDIFFLDNLKGLWTVLSHNGFELESVLSIPADPNGDDQRGIAYYQATGGLVDSWQAAHGCGRVAYKKNHYLTVEDYKADTEQEEILVAINKNGFRSPDTGRGTCKPV